MTASKERILKICEYCGKSFYASKSTTRYCSKQCNSYAYKAARREEKVKMAETMSHRKASEKSMSESNEPLNNTEIKALKYIEKTFNEEFIKQENEFKEWLKENNIEFNG